MRYPATITDQNFRRSTAYLLAREKKFLLFFLTMVCVTSVYIAVTMDKFAAVVSSVLGARFFYLLALKSSTFCFDEFGYRHRKGSRIRALFTAFKRRILGDGEVVSDVDVPFSQMKDVQLTQWELEKKYTVYSVHIELEQGNGIDCVGMVEESARQLRNELLYRIDHPEAPTPPQ